MPLMPIVADEDFVNLHFPLGGINRAQAFMRQPNVPIGNKAYSRTTPIGVNVRGYDAVMHGRGGSRSGMVKYIADPVIADWIVQHLDTIVSTATPPEADMQQSQSGRVVTLVAVSQGVVKVANAGDTAWTTASNNTGETPALNFTGLMQSTELNQKLWFVDGINYVYYDVPTNTLNLWTATSGSLPEDAEGNYARLCCTWRGRMVLSGLIEDQANWFMSAVSEPQNWDYHPTSTTSTQAIAGNNAPQGKIGDMITGLIPYTDDVLICGGDHTLYMMRGDPMEGGQIDLISSTIGMAWGKAWCMDPNGIVYFFSNHNGVYSLVPGQAPQRISQGIEQFVMDVDTGDYGIRLLWNDRQQGFHVFITLLEEPAVTTHLFHEVRTGAWWDDSFANTDFNPLACCTFDGNQADDRVALIGSWDGYVRSIDHTAEDDDGTDIESEVWIGPLNSKDLDRLRVKDLQAVIGQTSGDINYAVHVGETAEKALSSTAAESGTWTVETSGRNFTNLIRRSDHAIYIKLTSTNQWSLESIRVRLAATGKVSRRGR